VEVVRGEKRKVPACVAVMLDHVVLMSCDVLLVSREDDEVVPPCQLLAAGDGTEIVVGEEVHRSAGPVEPRDELQVPVVEAKRHAEVEKGPLQVDAAVAPADVPRVAPAVAVT